MALAKREDKLEQTRQQVFADLKHETNRHGLFSYAPPLSITDNSTERVIKRKLNEDQTVATGPKNFVTSPSKKGKFGGALFSEPSYITSELSKTLTPTKRKIQNPVHEYPFTPTGKIKYQPLPYAYQSDRKLSTKKPYRDKEGAVITGPPNFVTSPSKKGRSYTPGVGFSETRTHMADFYEAERELERANRKRSQALRPHDKAFNATVSTGKTFSNDQEIYYDSDIKNSSKSPLRSTWARVQHDQSFMPSRGPKSGLLSGFSKYPEHMPQSPVGTDKKRSVLKMKDQEAWKPVSSPKSTPIKPILNMMSNLRKEMRSLNKSAHQNEQQSAC